MKFHIVAAAALLAGLILSCLVAQRAGAEGAYVKTPADYEGPFYPVTKQQDEDNDLIHVAGRSGVAKGDILNLSGIVVNTGGKPLPGLSVEIWQTDPQGRYKHPGDSTPGERDPDFQYWGRAITGPDGTFFFKTLVPGAYEPRPAHIHYKVWRQTKLLLTSQIYFLDAAQRSRLPSMTQQIKLQTLDMKKNPTGEFEGFFRIVL